MPAAQKVVSIFEPHTDIIRKDRREILYGHKVFLTGGASGLIVDCFVERGNPADSTKAVKLAERAIKVLGRTPEQIVLDGGFSSRDNLQEIKALGIRAVAFSKAPGLSTKEMVKRTWLYQRLRNFERVLKASSHSSSGASAGIVAHGAPLTAAELVIVRRPHVGAPVAAWTRDDFR